MDDKDAKKVMEAVLFASNEVYTAKQLAIVLGNSGIPRVRSLIGELNQEYEQTNRTFRIVKIGEFDAQPCRGEHVSRTNEIGKFSVSSYELRENGRVRIRFKIN